MSEMVSNSVRHARLDAGDTIEVRVRGSRSTLHVDVIDPGPGFDPRALGPARRDGGWGLRLLDRLAMRWGVERDHATKVWFELSAVSAPSPSGTSREQRDLEEVPTVGEKLDKAKGHVKEAVGDMTDDERLEREGKVDRASGEIKGRAEDAKDAVGEGVDAVRDELRDRGAG